MAHIFVVLERTYRGVHPGSSLGLCLARDVASGVGATLTAICFGESSEHDPFVADAAGRFGADQLFFVGEEGFLELAARLKPRSLLVPATATGLSLLGKLGAQAAEVIVAAERTESPSPLPAHALVVAAVCPWHEMQGTPESEYESSARNVHVAHGLAGDTSVGNIYYLSSSRLDERSDAELALLQAQPLLPTTELVPADRILVLGSWPEAAASLSDAATIWIPGLDVLEPGTDVHRAHWVILGRTEEAIRKLHSRPWREILS